MSFYDAIRVGASGAADFEVERSLRFDEGGSHYLERTPSSASSRTTWTLSFWIKRCELGRTQGLFCVNGSDNNTLTEFMFASGNNLIWSASSKEYWRTTRVFRDTSAWYHIVIVCDTTNSTQADRQPVYINGVRETDFSTQNLTGSGTEFGFNRTVAHQIGRRGGGSDNFEGYMAEINFIDGQALTPSSFAETNSDTGQWVPIDTSGLTFGTNGYRLQFRDNSGTSATTLGKDTSGNGNNYTPNNFSVSAGTGNDSLEDTPTNNFPTLNPLNSRVPDRLSNGNLDIDYTNSDDNAFAAGSFGMKSGKWYFEVQVRSDSSGLAASMIGISPDTYLNLKRNDVNAWGGLESGSGIGFNGNNEVYYNGSSTGYGGTWATNDIIGIAVDADLGKVAVSKNGQFSNGSGSYNQGSTIIDAANKLITNATKVDTDAPYFVSLADTSSGQDPKFSINFGQRAFSYTPPTGYQSLCSKNLPDPTILLSNQHFNTVLYSGDGNSTKSITGVGFKPDWLWLKGRNTSYSHLLYDAVRGAGSLKAMNSNE